PRSLQGRASRLLVPTMQVIVVEPWDFSSSFLRQESLDIRIFRPPECFIRTFKDNLTVTKEQESCVGNAKILSLAAKCHLTGSVLGVLRSQCESIAHTVGDKNSCDVIDVPQCDDEFIDLSRCHGIQACCRFVIEHYFRLADQGSRERHTSL